MRIEFYERVDDLTDEEREAADRMGYKPKGSGYVYRRTYPKIVDICRPIEIPGVSAYCKIEFADQSTINVKGSYDDICIYLDDQEAKFYASDDE